MTLLGHSTLDVFPLTLGGNTFGWTSDQQASFAVLDAYVAGGGNSIDTADSYSAWAPGHSGGESEVVIGEWLRRRGRRDDVIIATKVSRHPDFRGLAAATVKGGAEASLRRLGTDTIDLYYAHYDDPDTPLEETASAFSDLVVAGHVRHIGVSNYSPERITEWLAVAAKHGYASPVALQPHYNLVKRQPYERDLAPVARDAGLGVLPYFGLAAGFLTGKYRTKADFDGVERGAHAGQYFSDESLAVIDVLREVASDHDASPASTALAWLLSKPEVVSPIASARNLDQLPDLLAAATLTLSADSIKALDDVSAAVPE